MLRSYNWFAQNIHGSQFQSGLPDIFAAHADYGSRWIEVKRPVGFHFTKAQREKFPALASKNIGIWILTDSTEAEYRRLFSPPNWWTFMLDKDFRS